MKWRDQKNPPVDKVALLAERRRQVREAAARGERFMPVRLMVDKIKPVIDPVPAASWALGSAELR